MIEAGSHPPTSHRPGRLLGGHRDRCGVATSLRTATLLRLDLGPALVDWLAAAGYAVGPLAGLALHEILVNAAVHGNLGVQSGPSTAWSDLTARQGLIEAALEDPLRAERLVTVALGWDAGQVAAVVADEGAGYRAEAGSLAPPDRRRAAGNGLRTAHAASRVTGARNGRRTRLVFCCLALPEPGAMRPPSASVPG